MILKGSQRSSELSLPSQVQGGYLYVGVGEGGRTCKGLRGRVFATEGLLTPLGPWCMLPGTTSHLRHHLTNATVWCCDFLLPQVLLWQGPREAWAVPSRAMGAWLLLPRFQRQGLLAESLVWDPSPGSWGAQAEKCHGGRASQRSRIRTTAQVSPKGRTLCSNVSGRQGLYTSGPGRQIIEPKRIILEA